MFTNTVNAVVFINIIMNCNVSSSFLFTDNHYYIIIGGVIFIAGVLVITLSILGCIGGLLLIKPVLEYVSYQQLINEGVILTLMSTTVLCIQLSNGLSKANCFQHLA